MNSKIPFVIPENDVNLRIARFIIIANELSYTQRGKLVLNIDKLIIFDFLLKYPYLLKEVLKVKNKNLKLILSEEEVGSVTTLYPSRSSLLDTNSAKALIKLMVAHDLLLTKKHDKELFFVISEKGKKLVTDLEVNYINRIKELCGSILVLRSTSTNDLKKVINPLVRGM